jgi:hypothetical protein
MIREESLFMRWVLLFYEHQSIAGVAFDGRDVAAGVKGFMGCVNAVDLEF